jgi:predicted nucleic acid-binding protein
MAGQEGLTEVLPTGMVSDTTALTTLMKCGLEWLLPELFSQIVIPLEVERELLRFHAALPAWCVVRQAPAQVVARVRQGLDAGEAEAIALALSENATTLLLDDKDGRRRAESLGLTCLAVSAVLVIARRQGLIPSLATAFATLTAHGRYRVDDETAQRLLRSVGEA